MSNAVLMLIPLFLIPIQPKPIENTTDTKNILDCNNNGKFFGSFDNFIIISSASL